MPTISVDAVDVRILEELQADGRLSNVALADAVGLSPSPCLRRVKRLEDAGVIAGYQAVVDREKVGLDLTVFVELSVERHGGGTQDRIEEMILGFPEVVACHMVSGQSDFLLEVVCRDLRDYERFTREHLQQLPEIGRIYSNFAITTVKANGRLPVRRQG
jgi:Lrp/AsnC family leucine-responsive transcriptional regulator